MDDMDDDSNEEMPEMPPLETPLVDPHPELPPWNVALPDPESLGSSGSSSDSDLSVFEDTFNDIMKERQAEESGVIDSVIEDYTLEADDAEAEVIDTNTIVSEDIIAQWKSREVIAPDGSRHDKQTLLKSIHLPDGMVISSSINALSMDRNSRVQGKLRHGHDKTGQGTSVIRSFNLAKGYNPNSSFEDTSEGTEAFMFDDAVVLLIKAKENPSLPSFVRLAVGRAKAFGRHGENAKESSVSIEDISKYHVTVAIEECIEVLSLDGKPGFQVSGQTLALLPKVPAASVVFTKPRMEIFQSSDQECRSEVDTMMNYDDGIFYARVFLLEELNAIYEMLTAGEGAVALSAGNSLVPALKSSGNNIFVVNSSIEREDLPVCEICTPLATIGKPGMDLSNIERLLRNHMARHIMEGKGWGGDVVPAEPCGWCGGGECSVKIIGGTKNAKVQVECKRFSKLKLPQFSLAMARKKTSKFPSTNHPLLCPGGCKSYIWSYNIIQHLLHSVLCSGRVSTENEEVKEHLPFLDEFDARVQKKNTEKERLRSLFKINVANESI
jgi:hypothetical protein